jgi:hypothetical protein
MDNMVLFAILTFAVIIGVVIAIIATASMNNDKKLKTKYDERQQAARGKSFAWGFYTALIASGVLTVLSPTGWLNFLGHYGYFVVIVLSAIVQFTYAVFHDAYVGLNTNLKKYMIFMTVVAIINLASSVAGIASGDIMIDGVLQTPFMNLLCTVMFVVLAVDLGIKAIIDKKEA